MSAATRTKLLEFFNDPRKLFRLMVELAIIVGIGEHFVKATYSLEGDGFLALICYDRIVEIRAAIQSAYYPNVQAVIRGTCPNDLALHGRWIQYAMACVQPGIDYFHTKLGDDSVMKAFKGARLFSPHRLNEMQPSAEDIDVLRAFRFLDTEINGLQANLPCSVG